MTLCAVHAWLMVWMHQFTLSLKNPFEEVTNVKCDGAISHMHVTHDLEHIEALYIRY